MKTWEKPQLIILVRSRPEESILQGCKWHPPAVSYGANSDAGGCSWDCEDWCDQGVES